MDIMEKAILLFLVFSRISGIFLLTPLFGNKTIPIPLKIGFSGFLTLVAFPIVIFSEQINFISIYQLLYFMIFEFFIGLIIGFISLLVLNSIYLAGVMVDRNIGFSMVSVISPQDESQIPITANFYYIIATLVFLAADLHHMVIKAILYSFKVIPIGYQNINLLFVDKVTEILRVSFIIGFKMSAPIIITIFVANVLLGILSRAMPQMNVFMVGMPLKVFIGLVTLFIILPLYLGVFNNIFSIMFDYIKEFFDKAI
ncbi:flagellar biosynthetic protein FliR [Wukongibacter baidiensis]|uniref:flagellar biosynthetic protein FliR n=1 Tax=Wukongibacter baidiensis TaxID=1723361 RepID=UPI003D7F7050